MPTSTNGDATSHHQDGQVVDLKAAWIAEVDRVAARRRWGRALMALAAIHLAFFLGLQALTWLTGGEPHWPYPITWLAEFGVVLFVVGRICGPRWLREPGMPGVVMRVWGTFFILSFSLASSNDLTGWEIHWFKAAWCTLGTFGWATMAWLFSLRFLFPAVGFYFVGLLTVAFPEEFYLFHGLAWSVTLAAVGRWLDLRRARLGLANGRDPRARSALLAGPNSGSVWSVAVNRAG